MSFASPSDRLAALPGYPFAEIAIVKRRLLARGVDVIDLGVGDSDAPPPEAVTEALRTALSDTSMHKYGFQQGLPAFRAAAVAWLERRFGQSFDAETELLPLIGSKDGLAHLPAAICNPGDLVIIPEPGYQGYRGGATLADAEVLLMPLRPENNFLLELDTLPAETLERARLVTVNYPNNPTAAVAPRDYLERLVATCRRYQIALAYDNAYVDLTYDGYVAPSIFEIPGARDIAIEFFSFSKSFRMTGWRLAFAVGNPGLIKQLTNLKTWIDTGPFKALQAAGVYALDHAEELIPAFVEELRERRDATVEELRLGGFRVDVPRGAMYLWVQLPEGIPSADFSLRALEDEGVVVMHGSAYGSSGEGFFRIALTVPTERLREGARRLVRALNGMTGAGGKP